MINLLTGCFSQQKLSYDIKVPQESSISCSGMTPTQLSASQWKERYGAAMLLGACADAIAYNRGRWEFNLDGSVIHEELKNLGGIEKIQASST